MSASLDPLAGAAPPEGSLEGPGSLIGPYKLLKQIGEGGFGTVFLAEREHPIRRRVALKILKPGMDTRQVVARFEAERQALALMDHPGIARVYDAGATAAGRPYFAMELVKGLPIQEYCDTQRLSTRERLALFVEVCRAVQHAHQKGIIHRDLKPSNVLVALQDGRPVPKVIDFGIAKALEQKLTDKTLFTEFRQMMGTPAYMSPEQADVSGLDVDTRSDIYSLGVMLYELLTGVLPFSVARLQQAGYAEILRIIREEQPSKPSTRVSTLGGTLPAVAACRRTEPRKLGALMRGELDWIVMKTLEKERARRYETADALAADVQRFLDDEPVEAGAPSRVYRARMFVRRHRVWVLASAALVLILGIGLAGTSVGLVRASDASARARKHTSDALRQFELAREGADLLLNSLTGDLQMVAGTREMQLALLGRTLEHYEAIAAEKQADAKEANWVRHTHLLLGGAYLALGDMPHAQQACDRFRDLVALEALKSPNAPQAQYNSACSLMLYGALARNRGDLTGAREKNQEALSALGAESTWESRDKWTKAMFASLHVELGSIEWNLLDFGAARADFNVARDQCMAIRKAGSQDWNISLNLGKAHLGLAKIAFYDDEDIPLAATNIALARAIANELAEALPNAPKTTALANGVAILQGGVLDRTGRKAEASKVFADALSRGERVVRDEPKDPTLLVDLCLTCERALEHALDINDLRMGQDVCERALQITEQLMETYPDDLSMLSQRGNALRSAVKLAQRKGDLGGWAKLLESCRSISERLAQAQPHDPNALLRTCMIHESSGNLARERGDRAEATAQFVQWADCAERLALAVPKRRSWCQSLSAAWSGLGAVALDAGKIKEAAEYYDRALVNSLKLAAGEPGNRDFVLDIALLHGFLGTCARAREDLAQAREHQKAKLVALEQLTNGLSGDLVLCCELADTYSNLASGEIQAKEFDEARKYNLRARDIVEHLVHDHHSGPALGLSLAAVDQMGGTIEVETGHFEEAQAIFQRGLERSLELLAAGPDSIRYRHVAADAYTNLGHVCALLGKKAEARSFTLEALKRTRELAEGPSADAKYLNSCAMLLLTCDPEDLRNAPSALNCALRGVEVSHGQEPAVLDTLALAHFTNGNLTEAVDAEAKALDVVDEAASPRRTRFEKRLAQYRVAAAAQEQHK